MKKFAIGKAKDAAMSAIENSPVGVVFEVFRLGDGLEPIFDEGESPAVKLQKMKAAKNGNKMRIYSDLDVRFQGMAFIVADALKYIMGASGVLHEMKDMGTPNCWWTIMPWKVQETLARMMTLFTWVI
jgi:hypothetical protein